MRGVAGVDSSLIAGIVGSNTKTGESSDCSDSGNTAVPSRLKVALVSVGAEVADGRGTVSRLEISVSPLDSDLTSSCCAVLNFGQFRKK